MKLYRIDILNNTIYLYGDDKRETLMTLAALLVKDISKKSLEEMSFEATAVEIKEVKQIGE